MLLQGSGERTPVTSVAVRDLKNMAETWCLPGSNAGFGSAATDAADYLTMRSNKSKGALWFFFVVFLFLFFYQCPSHLGQCDTGTHFRCSDSSAQNHIKKAHQGAPLSHTRYRGILSIPPVYFSNIDAGKVNFLWGVVVLFCFFNLSMVFHNSLAVQQMKILFWTQLVGEQYPNQEQL